MRPLADPSRIADRRLAALTRQVPQALAGHPEGVHQARVASRRLRELLPLLQATPEAARLSARARRQVRRLTRRFGAVRELDVALLALRDTTVSHPEHAGAAGQVAAVVEAERAAAAGRLSDAVEDVDLIKAGRRLLAAADAHAEPALRRTIGAMLAERLGRRGAAVRAAVANAGTVYAPDRLHQVRIALKKFRYALELAQDFGRFRLHGSLDRLKALQDLLGALHDDEVLAGRVRDCGAEACDEESRRALTALARHLDEEIRQRHAAFLAAQPMLRMVFHWARYVRLALSEPDLRMKRSDGPTGGRRLAGEAEAAS